ncbi:hypothetical protein CGJ15_27705, partial [Vibrio parahaemolyticus]
MCGVNIMQKIRSVEIRRRCGVNKSISQRAEEGLLRWFGHLERMDQSRMTWKAYKSIGEGRR